MEETLGEVNAIGYPGLRVSAGTGSMSRFHSQPSL
jgi:hypothetical protein